MSTMSGSTCIWAAEVPLIAKVRPISAARGVGRRSVRCSVADARPSSAQQQQGGAGVAETVVVGGGISGLCIAQALATKHPGAAPNIVVTEANGRVGGNITTRRSSDGYLWEEGPNSFQPSDPMLTMAVRIPFSFYLSCFV